jgi:hypothetical protein
MALFHRLFGFLFKKMRKLRTWVGNYFPLAARTIRRYASGFLTYPNNGTFRVASRTLSTNSQALQDVFARVVYSHTGLNSYLEIGSGDPERGNNTFILEKMGWSGVSVDFDKNLVSRFKDIRSNQILQHDATELDYVELLRSTKTATTGYLQIDIDPAHQSLTCLKTLPLSTHRFASITFEHDAYSQGKKVRDMQREILRENGYVMVRKDVAWTPGSPFEDWWVDATLLSKKQIRAIGRSLFSAWMPNIGPHGLGNYESEE